MTRNEHILALLRRLQWLMNKIDTTDGPNAPMTREARTLLWAIKDIVKHTESLKPEVAIEFENHCAKWESIKLLIHEND